VGVLGLDSIVVSAAFRSLVSELSERLGAVHLVSDDRWRSFAGRLDIVESSDAAVSTAIVVGPPAAVLKHAAGNTSEFGFVMPIAQLAKWWQSVPAWRDDATLELWRAGWSPLTVDRVVAPGDPAPVEFVIGSARPTPRLSDDAVEASR